MSRSVDLPDSVYAALEEAAAASGTTPESWIAARLPQPAPAIEPECDGQPESEGSPSPTLAERFAAHVGGFRSGRSNPSARYEGMFADAGEIPDTSGVVMPQRMIAVSEDVYRELEEEALAVGTTPAEWIASRLPGPVTSLEGEDPPTRTLAERLKGYIGLVDSGRTDLAERHSELFLDGLLEKQKMGRL